MKPSPIFWIGTTTALLLALVIMAALAYPLGLIFYLTVLGQALLVYTVFRVLRDTYSTTKTFDDWYEDHDYKE